MESCSELDTLLVPKQSDRAIPNVGGAVLSLLRISTEVEVKPHSLNMSDALGACPMRVTPLNRQLLYTVGFHVTLFAKVAAKTATSVNQGRLPSVLRKEQLFTSGAILLDLYRSDLY